MEPFQRRQYILKIGMLILNIENLGISFSPDCAAAIILRMVLLRQDDCARGKCVVVFAVRSLDILCTNLSLILFFFLLYFYIFILDFLLWFYFVFPSFSILLVEYIYIYI